MNASFSIREVTKTRALNAMFLMSNGSIIYIWLHSLWKVLLFSKTLPHNHFMPIFDNFSKNNASEYNTMTCELLLLRFTDSSDENDLKCAHKVFIDYR